MKIIFLDSKYITAYLFFKKKKKKKIAKKKKNYITIIKTTFQNIFLYRHY